MPNRQVKDSYPTSLSGSFLRFHRERNFLTLMNAANFLKIDAATIQRIERGESKNTRSYVVRSICDGFNQSMLDFENFDVNSEIHIIPRFIWEFIEKKYQFEEPICSNLSIKSRVDKAAIIRLKNANERDRKPKPISQTLIRLCNVINAKPYDMADYSTLRYYQSNPDLKISGFYTKNAKMKKDGLFL